MNSTAKTGYIETQGLEFSYRGQPAMTFPDLHFSAADHWLITGQSGSGKTTLLHLLAGLLKPASGSIHIGQQDITKMKPRDLDRFRGQEIGIVFQTTHFVQALSVNENLALARFLAKKPADNTRIATLLDRLGLKGKGNKRPHQLSVGEQQRASIARAMVNQPALVLADEPTASLDDMNCTAMTDLLRQECSEAGSTLVIVTHDQRIKTLIDNVIEL